MLNKIYKIYFTLGLIILPVFAFASNQLIGTTEFFSQVNNLVTVILIPVVFTLAVLFFFYGVVKYIWSAGGEKEEGKKIMIWGVIALFVMTSIWGLVYFLQGEFGIDNIQSGKVPTIQQ